jgi:hypothetical protein
MATFQGPDAEPRGLARLVEGAFPQCRWSAEAAAAR